MLFCPALDSWAQTAMRYPCKPPLAIVPAQSAHRLRQLLWSYHWQWQTTFQSYHLVKRLVIKRWWKLLKGGAQWVSHISATQTSWRIIFNDQGMLSVNSTRSLKVFWCNSRGGGGLLASTGAHSVCLLLTFDQDLKELLKIRAQCEIFFRYFTIKFAPFVLLPWGYKKSD